MMGLVVEFTGGRRCAGCGGWIDPARVRIFATAVICEPCRNMRRRKPELPGVGRGALHLVSADADDGFDEIPGE